MRFARSAIFLSPWLFVVLGVLRVKSSFPAANPQYGPYTKMNVVPVTIGALAPANDTFAPFSCRRHSSSVR